MTPGDIAALSLLDPDWGVWPDGHACRPADQLGFRTCDGGEYLGRALICWEVTDQQVAAAARCGAASDVVTAAREFLAVRA